MKRWTAEAPSNIALIKYMGKTDVKTNRPTNRSISYTLNHLITRVELEATNGATDTWEPLQGDSLQPIRLSDLGRDKFLRHLSFLKSHFGVTQNFIVRSANNFPQDCGLASSASSFAALTLAAERAALELGKNLNLSRNELSALSRLGSGSSCRSFFTPWAVWAREGAESIELPYPHLLHQVVVVNEMKKKVSSSEAHKLVQTSALFADRPQRAEGLFEDLIHALKSKSWEDCYHICWREFWDMHALFFTSKTPFGYMTADSLAVLTQLSDLWDERKDGPIVTMDAGPNVHLLFREDQSDLADYLRRSLSERYRVLDSRQ